MNQEEIMQLMLNEKTRKGITREEWEQKSGAIPAQVTSVLRGTNRTMGLIYVIRLLDALDLELVVRDRKEDFKKYKQKSVPAILYVGGRMEARNTIDSEGFFPRVDLFETPTAVLRFVPKPCDVYEIFTSELSVKEFNVVEHPFGLMYSYQAVISAEAIGSRVNYK